MKNEEARIEAKIQEQVQTRLAAALAEQQKQFAATLESVMKNALGGLDQSSAALTAERKKLEKELDAARELHRKAEREGEKRADEANENRRREYAETARHWVLHQLARQHLEAGKRAEDIADWLKVEPDFVEKVRESAGLRRASSRKMIVLPGNPKVSFTDAGRSGEVIFESDGTRFSFWWEMAISPAIAIVEAPTAENWEARTGLPPERREQVLSFIGQVIVDRQTHDGWFEIGENSMTIFSK